MAGWKGFFRDGIDRYQTGKYNVITMKAAIISIGNSKGIRIPKLLLEESGVSDEVELKVKKGEIKIIPVKRQKKSNNPLAAASESSFAKDWLRPEEEEAWAVYQLDK